MAPERDLELHRKVERCIVQLEALTATVGEVKADVRALKDADTATGLRVASLEQSRSASKRWSWAFIPLIGSLVVQAVWSKLGGK